MAGWNGEGYTQKAKIKWIDTPFENATRTSGKVKFL